VWRVEKGPLTGHVERVEQAGDRVVITAAGIIHDMFVNGTLEGGVNDVSEAGTQISVAARFEDGRHNLYPGNKRVIAVTRYLDGDEMVWRWGPWRNRLTRLDAPRAEYTRTNRRSLANRACRSGEWTPDFEVAGALDAAKGSQVKERFQAGVSEHRPNVCCVIGRGSGEVVV